MNTPDSPELRELTEKGARAWADVPDAAKWVREQRGGADTDRLDWLERNLMHLSHERATCSVDMGGRAVVGQLVNEARGSGGGPSAFRVAHPTIRQAIDAAMAWKKE